MPAAVPYRLKLPVNILTVPDLHKRDTDYNSIRACRLAQKAVQEDIIEYLESTPNSAFISFGDWYDKGYRNVCRLFTDVWYDRRIAHAADRGAFICTGNHLLLERDANPEMYIIQPSYLYNTREETPMDEPIFRTVPYIIAGKVQISFFHFNKTDKNYVQRRQPGVELHIGIYHDDCVLPTDIRRLDGWFGETSSEYLDNIFSNVDVALFGHIHTAVGTRMYTLLSGKQIPLIIPGAMSLTSNKESMKHREVDCPVISINEDGECEIKFQTMSTHMELLKIYENSEKVRAEGSSDITALKQENVELREVHSMQDYLKQRGYEDRDIETIMDALPGKLDLSMLVAKYGGD